MCIQTLLIGFATRTENHLITLDLTSKLFLSQDQTRRSILISSPGSGRITLCRQNPAEDRSGIVITSNVVPVLLTREDLGDFVSGDIYGISTVAGASIGVVTSSFDLQHYKQIESFYGR